MNKKQNLVAALIICLGLTIIALIFFGKNAPIFMLGCGIGVLSGLIMDALDDTFKTINKS